ncbi:MAG: ERCC4 domain-containing protein [Planctomycetota bacterium]|nr:ERCC4 domain-containing protein [Planctomycetota bacterium]
MIDTREQEAYGFDCPTVRRMLDAGDYPVDGLEIAIAVERKSLPDFAATVIHQFERFAAELDRLSGRPSLPRSRLLGASRRLETAAFQFLKGRRCHHRRMGHPPTVFVLQKTENSLHPFLATRLLNIGEAQVARNPSHS